MDDTYHYEEGAIHNDNKRIVNITGNTITGDAMVQMMRAFLGEQQQPADVQEADFVETTDTGFMASLPQEIQAAPKKVFRFYNNGFVVKKVQEAALRYYTGQPTELAYLMATFFDHGMVYDRSKLTDFVRALVAWEVIPYDENLDITQIANTMGVKLRKLPPQYQSWGEDLKAEKEICEGIAEILGGTIQYRTPRR